MSSILVGVGASPGRALGPVLDADPPATPGPVTTRLRALYAEMQWREAEGR